MTEYPAGVRIHTNQISIRVLGTLTGLGFLAVGGYALLGADGSIGPGAADRVWGFGVTALVGGLWAIGVSWLDPDLSGVWCRAPRRFR